MPGPETEPRRRDVLVECPIKDGTKIVSGAVRRVLEYWRDLAKTGTLPSRRDIDPTVLGAVLPHVLLGEWSDCGTDFRYRVCGGSIDLIHGMACTGKSIAQIWPGPSGALVLSEYRTAQAAGGPYLHQVRKTSATNSDVSFERILMPVSNDNGRPDMLFGAVDFLSGGTRRSLQVARGWL